jgi:NAD(P)-dependent dehydrogenase (short-subunit alcohol dehydrogenase family)
MENGKVALITGGAQGIGRAIAEAFLARGMAVTIAEQDAEAGREAERAMAPYGSVLFVRTDVASEKDVKRCVQETVRHFKRLDVLVNNAGLMPETDDPFDVRAWHRILGVNLHGAFYGAKYAAPYLKEARGSLLNIASTRALMSEPNTSAYSASKGALVALTHSLAVTLGPEVRVNCISPGWIDVSEWKKSNKRKKAGLRKKDHEQHPAGRVGIPQDVAALASFLISDGAGFITGQNYVIDGGMTRKMIYAA